MDVLTEKSLKPPSVTFDADDRRFVYAIARRIVASEQDADDVTQEAMLLAFRHRDAFRGDSAYRTWLHQIASSAALTFLRRTRRARQMVGVDAITRELVDPRLSPEAAVAERESLAMAAWLVDQLDPAYRDVLAMRVDDHHEADIARTHGITIANVKVRTHRARQWLRTRFDGITPVEARRARCGATAPPRLREERSARARARRR